MTPLHVTNGDHAGGKLRRFVDGPVTLACDVLHEGPCPPVDGDAWYEVRAQFLAGPGRPADDIKAGLAADDRAIAEACHRGDELVLWFEHDLFDQLAVIRTLDLIVRLEPDSAATRKLGAGDARSDATPAAAESGFRRTLPRVSLICIGSFPGIERFIGLGQLTVEQLATLDGTGVPMTAGHFALATDAWRAFRSSDPSELCHIAQQLTAARNAASEGGPTLTFLGDALLRFLAEFPSTANGLSRTEAFALQALLAGPAAAGALFGATQAQEIRPFLGDLQFFDNVRRLATARVPLVTIAGGADETDLRPREIAITEAGRDVLAHRADHVRLNGIDLWRGGVHLVGMDTSPWRWDAHGETLVS